MIVNYNWVSRCISPQLLKNTRNAFIYVTTYKSWLAKLILQEPWNSLTLGFVILQSFYLYSIFVTWCFQFLYFFKAIWIESCFWWNSVVLPNTIVNIFLYLSKSAIYRMLNMYLKESEKSTCEKVSWEMTNIRINRALEMETGSLENSHEREKKKKSR